MKLNKCLYAYLGRLSLVIKVWYCYHDELTNQKLTSSRVFIWKNKEVKNV
jgi:hypothetical protein